MKRFLLALVLLISLPTYGQNLSQTNINRLDSLFTSLADQGQAMGSISIYTNGKPVYSHTSGMASLADQQAIPATGETLYRIGSITKTFTALFIMKLVEEEKLDLDQNIASFFPDLKNADQVTIRQLLEHKSLLPIYHKRSDHEKLRKAKTEAELIAVINKKKPNKDLSRTTYNNLNYFLLGLIAEKVYQNSYNDILAQLLKPLPQPKIYGEKNHLDPSKGEARSFYREKNEWTLAEENSASSLSDGSGFLVSNASSLNEFMHGLFTHQLISSSTLVMMLPKEGYFGYGLMKTDYKSLQGFGHSGKIEGFTSACMYFPKQQLGISILLNGSSVSLNEIVLLLAGIVVEEG